MQIVVFGADEQWDELTKTIPLQIEWIRATIPFSFNNYLKAGAFFLLKQINDVDFLQTTKPVFVNSVIATAVQNNLPTHVLRINGWPTFLQRPLWEIAGNINADAEIVLNKIEKKFLTVADTTGLIAARVIAMIINEAYFTLGDEVSSKSNIDTAMKLGTNYPYGPFEWAEKIGLKNIYSLLLQLSKTDNRCKPAPSLMQETAAQLL